MRRILILIFVLVQVQIVLAQVYVIPIRYAAGTTYAVKSDMSATSLVSATNYSFATVAGEYFYHRLNDHTIQQYDLDDLSTMNDTLRGEWHTPVLVDADDSLWCYNDDSVFVYASDLSYFKGYEVDMTGTITGLALSMDNDYVYLCETDTDSLFKFSRANIRAEAGEEWKVKSAHDVFYQIQTTAGDTVLLSTATKIDIFDDDGNVIDTTNVAGGYYFAYCYDNYKIYSPQYGSGSDDREVHEYDLAGNNTGKATGLGEKTYSCAVSVTGDSLFVGIYANGSNGDAAVFVFDITGDWGESEAPMDTFQVADDNHHYWRNDVCGHIHYNMVNYTPPATGGNLIIINHKP